MFPGGTQSKPEGVPFLINDQREQVPVEYPTKWNVEPMPEHCERILQVVAKPLFTIFEDELAHASHPSLIIKNREIDCRSSCGECDPSDTASTTDLREHPDYCMTSLFNSSWLCKDCGREYCGDCRRQIDELTRTSDEEAARLRLKARTVRDPLKKDHRLMRCTQYEEHYSASFVPVSRFKKTELEELVQGMNAVLEKEPVAIPMDLDSSALPSPYLQARRDVADPVDPAGLESLPFHVFPTDKISEDAFKPIWAQGQTIVVTGLLPSLKQSWTPESLIERYGTQQCYLVDCDATGPAAPTVRSVKWFFQKFGQYGAERSTCWKLKVCPISLLALSDRGSYISIPFVGLASNRRILLCVP